MQPDPRHAALKKLADLIKDEQGRKQLKEDPDSALGDAAADLPSEVLATFRDLDQQELKALARVNETLIRAGLRYDLPDGGSVCIL
jgi:hypothetical protein